MKLPLVRMFAIWCLETMQRIWILGSKFILSNNQSRATLWVRETRLIVGLRPLIIILITASLSSKVYNVAPAPERIVLDEMWSMSVGTTLVCLHWMRLCMFGLKACNESPRSSSLGCSILLGTEWNISITRSQRSRAGIPSMRKPASRETISGTVELCETEVCLLCIQLIGTNVWLPKCTELLLMLILSLRDLLQNQSLQIIQVCIVVLCFTHNNIVGIHLCDEKTRSNAPNVCHKRSSILWPH